MKTIVTDSPIEAARFILEGEVVGFPTETVYGLGANIFDPAAIARIFAAKGRPIDNPLIAHISDLSQLESLAATIPDCARRLIAHFFPGPLTIILQKKEEVPSIATAGLDTIGVRMPDHRQAIEFLLACGVPLVAPSANLSGKPSPTTWQAVQADLDGRIACILKGEPTAVGLESTVVDCTSEIPLILRAGGVSLEELRKVVPETALAVHLAGEPPKSPGMKYRHYSPHAGVVLCHTPTAISPPGRAAYIGIDPPHNPQDYAKIALCEDIAEYARLLFQFFRECDGAGIETIFCQTVERDGLGLALMDRLEKASK